MMLAAAEGEHKADRAFVKVKLLQCEDSMKKDVMGKLTDKQYRFVQEYLIDCNAKQAAIRAGYSPKTAEVVGYQLLKKTSVSMAISSRQKDLQEKLQINQERVLQELACIAFYNPKKLFDEGGNMLPITQLDNDTARAIASINVDCHMGKGGKIVTKKIRFMDKNSAIEKAMKHLGLLGKEINLFVEFEQAFMKAMASLPEATRNDVFTAIRKFLS